MSCSKQTNPRKQRVEMIHVKAKFSLFRFLKDNNIFGDAIKKTKQSNAPHLPQRENIPEVFSNLMNFIKKLLLLISFSSCLRLVFRQE